jgi:hypothetical protein
MLVVGVEIEVGGNQAPLLTQEAHFNFLAEGAPGTGRLAQADVSSRATIVQQGATRPLL